jgi:hypothetical protein
MSTIDPQTTRCRAKFEQRPESEPPRRRGPGGLKAVLLAALGMVLVAGGCASPGGTVAEAGIRQPSPEPGYGLAARLAGADLPVVNCQLPPKIRRLGTDLTYLGAPRQIRTTARDCAIRGGDPSPVNTATRA